MTKEEIYTVLALFTLMGVVQKPSLTLFLMNQLVVRPSLLSLSWTNLKSSAQYYILQMTLQIHLMDHRYYSQFLTLYLTNPLQLMNHSHCATAAHPSNNTSHLNCHTGTEIFILLKYSKTCLKQTLY